MRVSCFCVIYSNQNSFWTLAPKAALVSSNIASNLNIWLQTRTHISTPARLVQRLNGSQTLFINQIGRYLFGLWMGTPKEWVKSHNPWMGSQSKRLHAYAGRLFQVAVRIFLFYRLYENAQWFHISFIYHQPNNSLVVKRMNFLFRSGTWTLISTVYIQLTPGLETGTIIYHYLNRD